MKTINKFLVMAALPVAALVGCGSDNNDSGQANANSDSTATTLGIEGTQIERLGRPIINEGLVLSNDYLNAFNMIPPSADLSDAASPVLQEAAAVITAADMLDGKSDITVAQIVGAFLPDAMRIDTRNAIPPGKTAYNARVSGSQGILTGGRKLEDDVSDITLSVLVAGDPTGQAVKDNVSYAGVRGNPNQPGHKLLVGQKSRMGAARFPFVPEPN